MGDVDVARQFDAIIDTAVREKDLRVYGRLLDLHGPPRSWRVLDVVTSFQAQGHYPQVRLHGVLDRLIDLKLQVYFIWELDVGLYNRLYYDELTNLGLTDQTAPTHLLLRRLSLDQGLIGKSRVAWERLMNLVYYLEHGQEIPGRSKKRAFFRWVNESADRKWRFLSPYEAAVTSYDERFRTPEFHKSSVLRAELMNGTRKIDANELLSIGNYLDPIWTNVHDVIVGRWPSRFTNLHYGSEFVVDGQYLEDGRDR